MSNMELIKELRALTQAGMKDCKDALAEAGDDLQKAVDIIKTKGLNIVSRSAGKVASEGLVGIYNTRNHTPVQIMAEVNCQTDFVANSPDFKNFVEEVLIQVATAHREGRMFDVAEVEDKRQAVVSTTKENIVVRRWWVQESFDASTTLVFPYLHSNGKIGVLLTLQAPSYEASNDPAWVELGNDLAMQVAAMSPLAVSPDHLDPAEVARQKAIFETQLTELKKPQAAWPKIIEGKLNKWHSDVCLLNQESVVHQKLTVAQVIKNVGAKLGGDITVINFIRCQAGEGIEKKQENLADEVAKLVPMDDGILR